MTPASREGAAPGEAPPARQVPSSRDARPRRDGWADACLAARLVALDPSLGIALRGPPGAARDHWLAGLRDRLPAGTPWRVLPAGTPEGRLVGGIDLAATLATGRLVASRGLMAEADGAVLLLPSAERLDAGTASHLGRALDTGLVRIERDGIGAQAPARLCVVALDDCRADDEGVPAGLLDRLALRLDLSEVGHRDCAPMPAEADEMARARARLPSVDAGADVAAAFCAAAEALGIDGLRAPIAALKVARACAALAGRDAVEPDDVAAASRLVLGPRATRAPAGPACEPAAPEQEPEPASAEAGEGAPRDGGDASAPHADDDVQEGRGTLDALAVEAAAASLPPGLLAALLSGAAPLPVGASGARRGGAAVAGRQGRPIGSRRGEPGRGARLDVLATLRAAAPWQGLRGRAPGEAGARVLIRRDDVRVRRLRDRQRTTTIFAVDASGSAALNRLGEAKGAVELLLAECYIRRDDVALVAFRGCGADVLLPPTRSPARAKRALASLPGGGPTPLAAGLDAALDLARIAARAGRRPVVALLTDGRGNVARDGGLDRVRALEDSHVSARALRAAGIAAVLIDVSPRPGPAAARLAAEMGATYLPLPMADARGIARVMTASTRPERA